MLVTGSLIAKNSGKSNLLLHKKTN